MAIDGAVLLITLAAVATAAAEAQPAADLVLTNARVRTGDPLRPDAEAMAVLGERIVAT